MKTLLITYLLLFLTLSATQDGEKPQLLNYNIQDFFSIYRKAMDRVVVETKDLMKRHNETEDKVEKEIIGYEINQIHDKILYDTFEMSPDTISIIVNKILDKMTSTEQDSLGIIKVGDVLQKE